MLEMPACKVAHQLGKLLEGRTVLLNVIPYNPTAVPYDYKPPEQEVVDMFNKVVRSYGVRTIQRQELGQDIDGACGQLVVKNGGNGEVGETMGAPIPPRGTNGACGEADLEDISGKSSKAKSGGTVTIKGRRRKVLGDDDSGHGDASAAVAAASARAKVGNDDDDDDDGNGGVDNAVSGTAGSAPAAQKEAGGEPRTVDTVLVLGAFLALAIAFLMVRILPKLLP